MELAEDEMKSFAKVWAVVIVSLCCCYFLKKITQKGLLRLIAILPIVLLFLILPFNLTSVHLTGITSFFISWLATFKLLLFAFGRGPLSSDPSISIFRFLAVASLPIKIQHNQDPSQNSENYPNQFQKSPNGSFPPPQIIQKSQNNQNPSQKSLNGSYPSPQIIKRPQKSPSSNYILKAALLASLLKIYDYSDHLHPKFIWLIYCLHIYLFLEFMLTVVASAAKVFLGLELEPQFNEPLLSTSLQDFWGRRWNLMVTSILRPTVYEPVLVTSTRIIGRQPAQLLAVFATFVTSGVMHELVFYHLGRVTPTLEVTCFFLLHGLFVCVEIAAKKAVSGSKWRLHRMVSGPLAVGFVLATAFWLFLPPLLRCRADQRGFEEQAAVGAFVKNVSRSLTLTSKIFASQWTP